MKLSLLLSRETLGRIMECLIGETERLREPLNAYGQRKKEKLLDDLAELQAALDDDAEESRHAPSRELMEREACEEFLSHHSQFSGQIGGRI